MRKKEYAHIKTVIHNYKSISELLIGEGINYGDFSPAQMHDINKYYE